MFEHVYRNVSKPKCEEAFKIIFLNKRVGGGEGWENFYYFEFIEKQCKKTCF